MTSAGGRLLRRMGCFVKLTDFPGKVEGLVHVSQIREGARLSDPSEVVRKNQAVWVKVIGMAASKLSMSMRDVDQQVPPPRRLLLPPFHKEARL